MRTQYRKTSREETQKLSKNARSLKRNSSLQSGSNEVNNSMEKDSFIKVDGIIANPAMMHHMRQQSQNKLDFNEQIK